MPDLQYRGFLASPVLGAPQGLSLYLDGVRLNEPFGDTVGLGSSAHRSDPRGAGHAGVEPAFRDEHPGRGAVDRNQNRVFRPGCRRAGRRWLVRAAPTGVRRRNARRPSGLLRRRAPLRRGGMAAILPLAGDERVRPAASYARGAATAELILLGAATSLTGNGPAPEQLLALDRAAVFTYPDRTENRMWMLLGRGERPVGAVSGWRAWSTFGRIKRRPATPTSGTGRPVRRNPTLLCSTGVGSRGEAGVRDAAGNPVAFDPGYDAALNGSRAHQRSYGVSAQLSSAVPLASRENHLFVGVVGRPRSGGLPSPEHRGHVDGRSAGRGHRACRSALFRGGRQRRRRARRLRKRHLGADARTCSSPPLRASTPPGCRSRIGWAARSAASTPSID